MNKLLSLSAALLLTVSAQASLAQGNGGDKPGKGKDGGGSQAQGPKDHPGKGGGGKDHPGKDHPGNGGGDKKKGGDWDARPDQRVERDHGPKYDRDGDPGRDRNHREVVVAGDRDRHVVAYTPYRDYGPIKGCPPGLAKKHNGCLPPGQAKKLQPARYDYRWGDYVRRYDGGYQYRYDERGSFLGYVPALGGALAAGRLWPTEYRYDPTPSYQLDYFDLSPSYDYRYADGAIYGVDPKTAMIQQVVALVTGQSAAVGQRMPSGFDVYNVPYAYRDQYIDGPDAAYRYNDGAVYQLDPKTQLIMAVLPLVAQAL